jgi:GntR family transcriptional regulator, transcriptional repressor for pyruvate dehydrogenase complex
MGIEKLPQFHQPIRSVRLSDQVAEQLQALMIERSLKSGDKLPSERDLCELLGVSRTVVREAVRSLVVKGLLEVRPGGGTAVRVPDTALVSELMTVVLRMENGDISFPQVNEVRRLLEVENAGLSAERHEEEDIRRIEQHLEGMRKLEDDARRWSEADIAFHALIAEATHNPLYPILLGTINELLMEVRLTGITLPGTPERAYQHHSRIVERIRSNDKTGARKAMLEHLKESEQTFQRASFIKFKQTAGSTQPGKDT